MAAEAPPLSFEDRPAARGVAQLDRRRVRVGAQSGANERDQPPHLVSGQPERRHPRARNARRQECLERTVRGRPRQAPAPQIDSTDADTGRAMAARAVRRIDARAGGNVGGRILAGMVLSREDGRQ